MISPKRNHPEQAKRAEGSITVEDWLGELGRLQALGPKPDTVPPRFATAIEWGARWKVSSYHAKRLITRGLKAGAWETQKFSVATHGRHRYAIPHYAEKLR